GALTRIFVHEVEQDTYTANGRTLVGTPFTFNEQVLFDSSGNVTHDFAGISPIKAAGFPKSCSFFGRDIAARAGLSWNFRSRDARGKQAITTSRNLDHQPSENRDRDLVNVAPL